MAPLPLISLTRSGPEPRPAELPLAGGSDGSCVEIELLYCGYSLAPPGWFYRQEAGGSWARAVGIGVPRERWLRSSIGAYLIRHPTAGPVLVDTALHPRAATDLRRDFGLINSRFFGTLQMRPEDAVSNQLRRRGIPPEELGTVVMTHLHVDHTSGMSEFPRATFLCGEDEWRATRGRAAELHGYVARHLPEPARVRTLRFDAAPAHGPFARTIDLLGDGSVRLISTPGHTPGHLSLLVRLAGREALLAGDALYTLRNLRDSLLPWRTSDDQLYSASLAELRRYAEDNPSSAIIPTHDAEVWEDPGELRG